MPEKLDSVHEFEDLRVSLILNSIVHTVVKKVIVILLVIRTKILIFVVKVTRGWNICLLICFNIQDVLLWIFGFIDFLKLALYDVLLLIQNFNDIVGWHSTDKRFLLHYLQRLLILFYLLW